MIRPLLSIGLALTMLATPALAQFKKAIDANIKYDNDVVMYASKTCSYCKKAEAYFKEQGVNFARVDVDDDEEAASELALFGGSSVPVFVIEGKIYQGFIYSHIDKALGLNHTD
ncbi:glutaredoxin family protein [Ferrimonas aestuarii]|nr:glutaredoxin family protein [Ferrimonas aestuarii]